MTLIIYTAKADIHLARVLRWLLKYKWGSNNYARGYAYLVHFTVVFQNYGGYYNSFTLQVFRFIYSSQFALQWIFEVIFSMYEGRQL